MERVLRSCSRRRLLRRLLTADLFEHVLIRRLHKLAIFAKELTSEFGNTLACSFDVTVTPEAVDQGGRRVGIAGLAQRP